MSPGDDARHDLLLARRQIVQKCPDLSATCFDKHFALLTGESIGDTCQQFLVVQGLFEEIDGESAKGFACRGNVAMTGHDDDRQFAIRLVQAFLDRQAVHAGHVDVEQHASPPFFFIRFQKTFGIPINGHTIILDTQQEAQGIADGRIVINNEYGQVFRHFQLLRESAGKL